jgi:hypothetical protein
MMHGLTASGAAAFTALICGTATQPSTGHGVSHHNTTVAIVRTVHDSLFGVTGPSPSNHHRAVLALATSVHDVLFE